jgi:uncharacterized repeat protein (TIGR03833 family)
MDGKNRRDIHPGDIVDIVLKKDQAIGKLTKGVVKEILTRSQHHPHGIKVRLIDGRIGRVKMIHPKEAKIHQLRPQKEDNQRDPI